MLLMVEQRILGIIIWYIISYRIKGTIFLRTIFWKIVRSRAMFLSSLRMMIVGAIIRAILSWRIQRQFKSLLLWFYFYHFSLIGFSIRTQYISLVSKARFSMLFNPVMITPLKNTPINSKWLTFKLVCSTGIEVLYTHNSVIELTCSIGFLSWIWR